MLQVLSSQKAVSGYIAASRGLEIASALLMASIERGILKELRRIFGELRIKADILQGRQSIDASLLQQVYSRLELAGAEPMLLAIVGSCRDTQTDGETLEMLRDWSALEGLKGWRSFVRKPPTKAAH